MTIARDPRDTGAQIRAARRAHGLTQAELAAKAGVGRQWLVALEGGHERAELGKVLVVLGSLGLALGFPANPSATAHRTWLTATDTARAIREELERGDRDFALRMLARALAEFRELTDPDDVSEFLAEPPSTGDIRWDTLLAACVGRECRKAGINAPRWTRPDPLAAWWFPVFDPILAARTMQRTPVDLASRGIWLEERALEVV